MSEFGREPTPEELSKKSSAIAFRKVRKVFENSERTCFIRNSPVGDEEDMQSW